ncbi:MAG TPA: CDC27 family protein [Longimicrobiales bacterium]|nr:CDC27 family protein [Longimicrobiales bacterium]
MARILHELLRRRVLHVLGIYLAAGWGILEFTDWAVTRFGLQAPLVMLVFLAGCVVLPFVVLGAWRAGAPDAAPTTEAPPRSVAVLPFMTVGGDADTEFLGFGLADQILTNLARVGDLDVVARTSSFACREGQDDVRAIGRKLGARAILEGSLQRAGDRLRVTTQLINAEDGYHLWSERYDRTMDDVFRIQDEIAANVARVLRAVLTEHEREAMSRVPTQDIRAYELYLRGRRFYFEMKRRSLEYARDLYRRAIELDPHFALAYAGVAECTAMIATYYPAARADLAAGRAASERALELEPRLAEAHSASGAVLFVEGKVGEAEAALRRAVDLDPRLYEARYILARALFQQGRFDEAAALFKEAFRVRADTQAAFFAAQAMEAQGRHEAALEAYGEALVVAERHMELNPDDARTATMRAVSLCRLGRVDEGLVWAEEALTIDADDAGVRYNVACLFSLAGRTERALACLEEALAVGFGNRAWLERDPDLDGVRSDPRFGKIVARLDAFVSEEDSA